MAICLGSTKVTLNFGGSGNYLLNIVTPPLSEDPTVNRLRLLSSDGYILKDLNNVFLTTKESE